MTEPIEVEGLGLVYLVHKPLDQQLREFEQLGAETISPEKVVIGRLQGKLLGGTRTSMAPIALKGEETLLAKNSILMNPIIAGYAVRAHSEGRYPEFDKLVYEIARNQAEEELRLGTEPEDRTVQILSCNEDYDLTLEMDDSRFILGTSAQKYFKKFDHSKIRLYNLPQGNIPKGKTIVNYMWFGRPDCGSDLNCRYRGLDVDGRAFWVKNLTGEASSQNSLTRIKRELNSATIMAMEETGLTGIKDTPFQENLISILLEKLRNQ